MRWISTFCRSVGVFIQVSMRVGISSLALLMDMAAEIGPPQLSARYTSRSKRSIVRRVNAEISPLSCEMGKCWMNVRMWINNTTFLVAVKKKGCVGLSYVRGDPTTWHSLSCLKSKLHFLLDLMFFLLLLPSSSMMKIWEMVRRM